MRERLEDSVVSGPEVRSHNPLCPEVAQGQIMGVVVAKGGLYELDRESDPIDRTESCGFWGYERCTSEVSWKPTVIPSCRGTRRGETHSAQ